MLSRQTWTMEELPMLEILDLPESQQKEALLRRREAIGLPTYPHARVMVHNDGSLIEAPDVPMQLRFARATRISIEGNAHFCRGLLATRYDDADSSSAHPGTTDQSRSLP